MQGGAWDAKSAAISSVRETPSDMETLRTHFDTNGDGKLTSTDADFAKFKVLATNADGSTTARTLTQLGITEINLTEDSTRIELPDGSMIEGQTSYKKSDGSTGTVASTALMAEVDGKRVTEAVSTDANDNRVVVTTAYDAASAIVYSIRSVTTPSGANVTNSYDDDGDGVANRIQTIDTVANANGPKTETVYPLGTHGRWMWNDGLAAGICLDGQRFNHIAT